MRIAVVCQDLHPYDGGGIAPTTSAIAGALAELGAVTYITAERHQPRYEAEGRRGVAGSPGVRVCFASAQRSWSAGAWEALRAVFAGAPPDFVHFPDYLGEGFATLQARRDGDPLLRDATIAVRLHTTDEIVAVLNGHLPDEPASRERHARERFCLRHADRLLWPGGDILATYERFYGPRALAPGARVPDTFLHEGAVQPPPAGDGPLRLLYLGRLERRKGVDDLVEAMRAIDADWCLELVGADTPTAGGGSMRERVESLRGGDPRIALTEPVPRAAVGDAIARHDAVVVPSLWECWPNVVREALRHGRPVIATPVGGHVDLVRAGVSGWLARGTGARALREAIEPHVRDPAPLRELARSGRPQRLLEALADGDGYAALLREAAAPPRRRAWPRRAASPRLRRAGADGDAAARRVNRRMRWTA